MNYNTFRPRKYKAEYEIFLPNPKPREISRLTNGLIESLSKGELQVKVDNLKSAVAPAKVVIRRVYLEIDLSIEELKEDKLEMFL